VGECQFGHITKFGRKNKLKTNHRSGAKDHVTSTKFMVATKSCFYVYDFEKFVKVVTMWHP
jgi:hypothetical protein